MDNAGYCRLYISLQHTTSQLEPVNCTPEFIRFLLANLNAIPVQEGFRSCGCDGVNFIASSQRSMTAGRRGRLLDGRGRIQLSNESKRRTEGPQAATLSTFHHLVTKYVVRKPTTRDDASARPIFARADDNDFPIFILMLRSPDQLSP